MCEEEGTLKITSVAGVAFDKGGGDLQVPYVARVCLRFYRGRHFKNPGRCPFSFDNGGRSLKFPSVARFCLRFPVSDTLLTLPPFFLLSRALVLRFSISN